MKSEYELLFKSHQTKSTLYLKLQKIANKMTKIKGFESFMKTIFQEAHVKRLSDEPYPLIPMFIKYYDDNYRLLKSSIKKDIVVLDTIINEAKKSYLWLTEVGRSTHPSYTPEVHSLYNSTQDSRYAPPPPSGIPSSYVLPPPSGPPPGPSPGPSSRPSLNSGKRNRRRTRVTRRRRKPGKKSRKINR